MKDFTCRCIGNEAGTDHALWCPASGYSKFSKGQPNTEQCSQHETPDLNYKPKIIGSYSDKELEYMRQCDCDTETSKWLYTIDRLKDEFHKSLKTWMDNVRPPTLKEAEEQHVLQLAAIMTASIQNTDISIKDRITKDNPYWTVAYSDVCHAIDREMKLIKELRELTSKVSNSESNNK